MDKELYSITALFNTPEKILIATKKIVELGYTDFDVSTPYPLHGLDEAMELKKSKLGNIVFPFGLLGGLGILGFMIWTTNIDYPLNIGGKPYFSLPAYIPITFEMTILSSAITIFIVLFVFLSKLPDNNHPLHETDYMNNVSKDKFGITIQSKDPIFEINQVKNVFKELNGENISEVYFKQKQKITKVIFEPKFITFIIFIVISTYWLTDNTLNKLVYLPPFNGMDEQNKLQPEKIVSLDKYNFKMPTAVKDTVPRGLIPDPMSIDSTIKSSHTFKYLDNPLLSSKDVLETGKVKFNTYCSPCHGYSAKGSDSLLRGKYPTPPNLLASPVTSWQDGQIYNVITNGQNMMPSYASQISREERWSIILYLRILQQNETQAK